MNSEGKPNPPLPASLRKPARGATAPDLPLSIRIWIVPQRLELRRGEAVIWSVPVSTSQYGVGTESGSYKTPTGRFRIAEKIGSGAPLGARFEGRKPTGEVWPGDDDPAADWVLTRILWLAGEDPDNANTHARYIYLHGTNQEGKIGTPASHGCIRLRNVDVVELFDQVGIGTAVEIA